MLSAIAAMAGPAGATTHWASSTPTIRTEAAHSRPAILAGTTRHGCPYYDFCAYSGENYNGQKIEMYYCQYYSMPFGGNGSFVNNQTPGTVAKGYDQNYNYIWNSGKAYSEDDVIEWTQIWYVKPC
jgi:hypothetical protein